MLFSLRLRIVPEVLEINSLMTRNQFEWCLAVEVKVPQVSPNNQTVFQSPTPGKNASIKTIRSARLDTAPRMRKPPLIRCHGPRQPLAEFRASRQRMNILGHGLLGIAAGWF